MLIANPIYDGVFKYLMEDEESAKLLLSAIIGQKVISINFMPQEHTGEVDVERQTITVYRMDFAAKVETPEGAKSVLIEIQKAKYAADIMRFRKYLGEQYAKRQEALPIVTIYFLGYALEHTDAPVIKVNRVYEDLISHKEIKVKEEFIESLTHDSYVIQIPYLDSNHKNELESLLSIFDQKRQSYGDKHILSIDEDSYPSHYRRLIRRLVKATAEPVVKKKMELEDEFLEELENMERRAEQKLEEKDKVIEEKDRALDEKDKALDEKDKALDESKKQIAEQEKMIKKLLKELAEN